MYVDQRHATLDSVKPLETQGFLRRTLPFPLLDLDRRTFRSWIALVALSAFVAVVAACSSPNEGAASSQSALAESGRWALPASVSTVGAKVRVAYDEAPKWTGSAACTGKLKPGGHKLGEYLIEHFNAVASVGGYACRRNTADASRMSVHGTGRALDVFIPMAGGAADNGQGDKVANWLVLHAQRIGVQLVIWDKTIWRANGRNDGAYGGPNPHADHIHVELTIEAAAMSTPWFSDMGDGDGGAADGGADDEDRENATDGGRANDGSTGTQTDPGTTEDDASIDPTDDGQQYDAGTTDPADDDTIHEEPDADTTDPGADPGADVDAGTSAPPPPIKGDPSDGLESAGDAPGETDSLPDVPKPKRRASTSGSTTGDEPTPNSGCSAAPRSSGTTSGTLALVLGLALVSRLRRRTRRP
jgi:hypothetical protein